LPDGRVGFWLQWRRVDRALMFINDGFIVLPLLLVLVLLACDRRSI
jgi:ABC-type dipeptide/oligopeptide/nickel transport system permease subunit